MSNRKKSRDACAKPSASARPRSHNAIVSQFVADWRDNAARERRYFSRFPTFPAAIEAAALSEYPKGKRHPHQRRIPHATLRTAARRLLSVENALTATTDFEELHHVVQQVVGGVSGIGELSVYDIATRIGAARGLEPNFVFVHAGVRRGAKALGFRGRDRITISELPGPFARLTPGEAEDCLCIFKAELEAIAAASMQP